MKILKNILVALFIFVMAILILLPFAWILSVAFRPSDQIMKFPPRVFGGVYTLAIFPQFLAKYPFFNYFGNTAFVATAAALGSTLTSTLAGFAFAKYKFKGNNFFFSSLMASLMIPIFVILIPLFLMMQAFGWYDTYYALIIPFIASPIGVFLMRQFCRGIPDDLLCSARIDGCSEYKMLFKIVTPTVAPAMASLFILSFMGQWDSLLWPVIITTSKKMRVLTVALLQISNENGTSTNWNLTMVGAVLSTVPIVVLYLFMQRWFISSITMTGIKE